MVNYYHEKKKKNQKKKENKQHLLAVDEIYSYISCLTLKIVRS